MDLRKTTLPAISSADNFTKFQKLEVFDTDLETRRRKNCKPRLSEFSNADEIDAFACRSQAISSLQPTIASSKIEEKRGFLMNLIKKHRRLSESEHSNNAGSPARKVNAFKFTRAYAQSADKMRSSDNFNDSINSGCRASRKIIPAYKIVQKGTPSRLIQNRSRFTSPDELLTVEVPKKNFNASPCLKSTQKMPLPLYPNQRKRETQKEALSAAKIHSHECGRCPVLPRKKLSSNSTNDTVNMGGDFSAAQPAIRSSAQEKRKKFKLLCKGQSHSEGTDSSVQNPMNKRRILPKQKLSNLSVYKLNSIDDKPVSPFKNLSSKLPKIKSHEISHDIGQEHKFRLNVLKQKQGSPENKLEYSPIKYLQNEKMPVFKFSMSNQWSSHKALPSLKLRKQSDLSNEEESAKVNSLSNISKNVMYKSPEHSIKIPASPSVIKAVKEVREDKEDDTFCLNDDSLCSAISKDASEVLSVSISEDSLLSELTVKSKKKRHIIKLPKKTVK